ncbi:response regulator [Singulisphaera sp. PoT]|uniref:hybrid sensor histidine kinase/response regulator n=1 Tax=Singulisphaera sp. PoT TaxID=3411797 RepID=UPI003BF5254C
MMSRIRILLLEDDPLDADLVRTRMAKGNVVFDMDRVDTREAFLHALEAQAYDLILADYSLPSFDGLSALELAHEGWPHIPFLFVSGGLGEEVAIESLKRGATDYVLKHRLDRLVPAVNRAIAESRERSERRKAEQALRESEERHRLILESVADYAIFTLDLDGRVSSWNKGAERVLGYHEAEILGNPLDPIFEPEDVRNELPSRELEQAAKVGRSEGERWYLRKDGERFWGNGVVRPLRDVSGKLQGFVKVMQDTTERKRTEEALREADRRKDDFLAMLAHELRNPLSTINNAIQLARYSGKAEHFEWAKEVIGQQVKHLARLIDDLLDVSRITRGKIQLRVEKQDVGPILRSAVEATRRLIQARGHDFKVSLPSTPIQVEADATRLEQIIVNLLTNAAKYTEEGGEISIDAEVAGPEFVINVRDNGIGISAEMLAQVFDPFVQVEQSIDRSQGGLGIGLTLARTLAEMHGGRLGATSQGLGTGSVFTVTLPLADGHAHERDGVADHSAILPNQGFRILVVDDNVDSAKGLAHLLATLGHEVWMAFDGVEALESARQHEPRVVLLDIGLPGMDGYQVAGRLREQAGDREVILIAVTGYGQDDDRRRALAAGFDYHLIKPVDFDELASLLLPLSTAPKHPGQ